MLCANNSLKLEQQMHRIQNLKKIKNPKRSCEPGSFCDPGGIRTPNQQYRKLSFYPVELQSQQGWQK